MATVGDDDRLWRRTWQPLFEALVWSGQVVVRDELGEHPFEMAPAENGQVVQALAANGAHPALGEGVRARAPVGRPEDPNTFGQRTRIAFR